MKLRKLTPLEMAGPVGVGLNARRSVALSLASPEPGTATAQSLRPAAEPSLDDDLMTSALAATPDADRLTRADRRSLVGGGPEVLGLARHGYLIAGLAAATWSGVLVAFEVGYENRFGAFEYPPFALVVFGALVLMPSAFMMLGAFSWRQAAKLAAETRRARALAGEMLAPAALAALQAGGAVEGVRHEIDRAAAAALHARDQLSALRESLAGETERLTTTAMQAGRTAQGLTASLAHERGAIGELSAALDGQTHAIAEAITRQAHTVGEASDLARAQAHEAQAGLAAGAAELAGAAGRAAEAADLAGRSLSGETERLERAGAFLGERYRGLEATLSDRHAALASLAVSLDADQAALDDRLARRRADIQAASTEGGEALARLGDAAVSGVEAVRALADAAAEQARQAGSAAREEQASLETRAREGLGAIAASAAEQRAEIETDARAAIAGLAVAVEQARLTIARHAEQAEQGAADRAADARSRIDELNEAAFAAGQRADQTFEARIAAARRLVDQSAAIVDQAGERSAARIEAGLVTSKEALIGLQGLLGELDGRIGRLPIEVQTHADALRAAVNQGVDELTAAARRAADDTGAIDAAFQARVRRNYEMLSEAVQLMGKVAGEGRVSTARTDAPGPQARPTTTAGPQAAAARPVTAPTPRRAETGPARAALAPDVPARAEAASERTSPALRPAALAEPPRQPSVELASPALRPRLKLGAADDAPLAALFEPTPPASPLHSVRADPAESWTWKDLLSSIEEVPVDDETLADRLVGEIEGMGIDAAALLPVALTDEIARAVQARDAGAVAAAVKRAAPAAVRRLSRRLSTDKVLRAHAERYLGRYEALMGDAVRRDPEGFIAAALLGSDAGRAGLLLDVARREPA